MKKLKSRKESARSRRVRLPNIRAIARRKRIARYLIARRGEVAAMRRQHKQQLRAELVRAFYISCYLRASADAWLDFCRAEEWNGFPRGPKVGDQADCLRYVIRMFVGFKSGAATKRASLYYRALNPLFQAGVKTRDVPRIIAEHKGLASLAASHKKDASPASDSSAQDRRTIRVASNKKASRLQSLKADDVVRLEFRVEGIEKNRIDVVVKRLFRLPTRNIAQVN